MTGEDGFDEELWNRKRITYQNELLAAASDLMFYMGCDNITIPFDENTVVKIVPKEEK